MDDIKQQFHAISIFKTKNREQNNTIDAYTSPGSAFETREII